MKKGKLILYNILTFLLLLNTYYLYFGHGLGEFSLSGEYLKEISLGFVAMFILILMNFFVTMSYVSSRALVKKNYLRINFILIFIIIVTGLIMRVREILAGKYMVMTWANTLMYALLMIIIISMLRELYNLIKELFSKNHY